MAEASTISSIHNVVVALVRISSALPDNPNDAITALIFALVDTAAEAGQP